MNTILLYHNRKWNIPDNMIYKNAAWKQDMFIRDTICFELLKTQGFVVSEHRSKSIELPVYGFIMRNGVKVIARDNFYDWKLSIEVPKPLPKGFIPDEILTWHNNEDIPSCYLEGFKEEWAWPAYDPNSEAQTRFTIEIYGNYDFYMLMFMLKNAFTNIEYEPSLDLRSVDEIQESIEKIYSDNGFYEMYDPEEAEKKFGWKEEEYCSGWEILKLTHSALDGLGCKWMDISDNPKLLAEHIVNNPEIHKVFLTEENMFNTKF